MRVAPRPRLSNGYGKGGLAAASPEKKSKGFVALQGLLESFGPKTLPGQDTTRPVLLHCAAGDSSLRQIRYVTELMNLVSAVQGEDGRGQTTFPRIGGAVKRMVFNFIAPRPPFQFPNVTSRENPNHTVNSSSPRDLVVSLPHEPHPPVTLSKTEQQALTHVGRCIVPKGNE